MSATADGFQNELHLKISLIRQLLSEKKLDAMLLQRVSSIAWAACGADVHINTAASNGDVSLLITPEEKFLFTNNIEAARLEDEEGLSTQDWIFKISPWYENESQLNKLIHELKLGTDGLYAKGTDLSAELAWLRAQLTPNEVERFRKLAGWCAQSMKEAVEAVRPGMSEYQIAALLSHATEKRGVQAVVNLIATDERIFAYRHPSPTEKELRRYAMLILCGRKWGLICSISRLVHFGPLPDEIRFKSMAVANIDATIIAATRPGHTLADVFLKAESAYEEFGFPDEWQKHHQGGLAGYEPREITATPETKQPILKNQVYAWNPSITGVKSEDTILVGEKSNEVLTEIPDWPAVEIRTGNGSIKRPAILEKD